MKLFFSLCLLIPQVHSRDYFVIRHENKENSAIVVLQVLKEKFSIPEVMIEIENVRKPCIPKGKALMEICIKNNEDIEITSVKKEMISKIKIAW